MILAAVLRRTGQIIKIQPVAVVLMYKFREPFHFLNGPFSLANLEAPVMAVLLPLLVEFKRNAVLQGYGIGAFDDFGG